jgi:hypothetical protein
MVEPDWLRDTGEELPKKGTGPKQPEKAAFKKPRELMQADDEEMARGYNISDVIKLPGHEAALSGKIRWNDYLMCIEWAAQNAQGYGPWQVMPTPFLNFVGAGLPEDVGDGGPEALSRYLTPEVMRMRNAHRVVSTPHSRPDRHGNSNPDVAC